MIGNMVVMGFRGKLMQCFIGHGKDLDVKNKFPMCDGKWNNPVSILAVVWRTEWVCICGGGIGMLAERLIS